MNVNVKLKELLDEDSRDNVEIARKLGMSNGQALDSRLRPTSTPKIDFVAALLDQLGYALVVVPATYLNPDASLPDDTRLPKRKFVIEPDFEYKPMSNRAKGAAARIKKQQKNSEK